MSAAHGQESSSRRQVKPRPNDTVKPISQPVDAQPEKVGNLPISDVQSGSSRRGALRESKNVASQTGQQQPEVNSKSLTDETPSAKRIGLTNSANSEIVRNLADITQPLKSGGPIASANTVQQTALVLDENGVPIPALEDPEQFRVEPGQTFQQEAMLLPGAAENSGFSPMPSQEIQSGPYSSLPIRQSPFSNVSSRLGGPRFMLPQQRDGAYDDENSLLNNLPVSNLNQGLTGDAMGRAAMQHSVGDPYLASRSYASDYRDGAMMKTKTWRSPNMKHRPLYFEEANLERYGQAHPKLQPVLSGLHFFSSVAFLPYKTGVTPPNTCVYSIGHDRPGDCVPAVKERHPLNRRAALRQAAVIAAGVAGL
jgi:hypothetical protein